MLFFAKGCTGCHRHAALPRTGEFVTEGPPNLTGYDPDSAFVRRWLADPQAVRPGAEMPDLDLSDAEIEALIAFLEDAGDAAFFHHVFSRAPALSRPFPAAAGGAGSRQARQVALREIRITRDPERRLILASGLPVYTPAGVLDLDNDDVLNLEMKQAPVSLVGKGISCPAERLVQRKELPHY